MPPTMEEGGFQGTPPPLLQNRARPLPQASSASQGRASPAARSSAALPSIRSPRPPGHPPLAEGSLPPRAPALSRQVGPTGSSGLVQGPLR